MLRPLALLCSIAAAGCAQHPQLDAAISEEARGRDFPKMLSMRDFGAQTNSGVRPRPRTVDTSDRADDLRRRADLIRQIEPIPPDERSRMLDFGSNAHPGRRG